MLGNIFNTLFDCGSIPNITPQVIQNVSQRSSISKKIQPQKIRTRRSNATLCKSSEFSENIVMEHSDHTRSFLKNNRHRGRHKRCASCKLQEWGSISLKEFSVDRIVNFRALWNLTGKL